MSIKMPQSLRDRLDEDTILMLDFLLPESELKERSSATDELRDTVAEELTRISKDFWADMGKAGFTKADIRQRIEAVPATKDPLEEAREEFLRGIQGSK